MHNKMNGVVLMMDMR